MQHLTIANQWINSLLRAFASLGLNTDRITSGLKGFESGQLLNNARVELSDARTMWHRAAEQSDDPILGIKVGMAQDYRSVGVLAPVIWHSPSVRLALNNIQRYQKLISESGLYQHNLDQSGHLSRFTYIPATNHIPVHPHQVLAVIVGTIAGISDISNSTVLPIRLHIPRGLDEGLISAALNCTTQLSEDHFRIDYDNRGFETPLLGCDSHLYEINKAYAEELLLAKNESLALIEQVKLFVIENGAVLASIDQLEQNMGLNKRSIQRYLKSQGTSFRETKEQALKELAMKYLVQDKLRVDIIAQKLQYSEVSAFHRAFKSWFGISPKQFGRSLS